ncbi:MAG: MFS transporter [Gemmatimonadota bacterium]|nr:MAG: MFS transporter [Gemmatimonadota bacterium]
MRRASPDGQSGHLIRDRNLHIVFSITLIAVLAVSSITPAFPQIARALDVSPAQIGWLISAFTVPGIFLTPLLGMAADRWGRRQVLVPSLLLFAAAGAACALAPDFRTLVILRLLQGVGGASLGALNLTIISDLYSGPVRTEAMGYNASVLSVGTASYPAIGGALALLGWNYPFLLALLGIPVALLVLFGLPRAHPVPRTSLRDYLVRIGRALTTPAIAGMMFATVTIFIMLFGSYMAFFPALAERSFGASSLSIGLVLSTGSVVTAITSSRLGRLAGRFGKTRLARLGFVFFGLAMLGFPAAREAWQLFVSAAVFGAGAALSIPTILNLLADHAPEDQRGAFLSINGMLLRLGQTLGPILMGGVVGWWNVEAAFYAAAALALDTLLLLTATLPRP